MLQQLLKEYSGAPKIEQAYVLLIGLFCISLPLEGYIRAAPNLFLIPLVVLAPFMYALHKPSKRDFRVIAGWGGFVLLVGGIGLASGFFQQEGSFMIRLLLIVLVALLLVPVVHWGPVKRMFILGVALALLISLGKLLGYALASGAFDFSSGGAINQVLITDRLYLGFFATLALVFSIELAGETTGWYKRVYLGIAGLCVLFVLLVAARMALLSMLLLGGSYFIYRRKGKKLLVFVLAASLTLVLFFALNPNLRNRFLHADKGKSFVENVQQWEPRFLIWGCAVSSFSGQAFSPVLGFGSFGVGQEALGACIDARIDKERKRAYYQRMAFNPHNQFLEWILVFGFVVGVAFLGYMGFLFYAGRNSFSALGWAIAFVLFALVESFVHRQMGVYLFALLIGLCGMGPARSQGPGPTP